MSPAQASLPRVPPAGRPLDAPADRPFVAADVGGTHVRLALLRAAATPGQPPEVLEFEQSPCAAHAGLEDAVGAFLQRVGADGAQGRLRAQAAVIATAGHQLADGRVLSANLPWPVDLGRLRERLGLREVRLVNDFEALAHAAPWFDHSAMLRLSGPHAAAPGPVLVIGPGTGFGSALWLPGPHGGTVLATEAGQATLAVGTARELAVADELMRTRGHVAIEHALSGPGLVNLYRAVCALDAIKARHGTPRAVVAAALAADDPHADEALRLFCALLGATAADLALATGARSVVLAGGILPNLRDFLPASDLAARFLAKGVMREALEGVRVLLVEHGRLGVLGAAAWYLDAARHHASPALSPPPRHDPAADPGLGAPTPDRTDPRR